METTNFQISGENLYCWVVRKVENLPVPVILSVAIGWLVFEFIWLGKFSLFIAGDNFSVIPYQLAFSQNEIPRTNWTPFPAAGTSMLGTGQATLIFRAVFSVLPGWAAFQLLSILPVCAAVLGTYGLCRRHIGLSYGPSIFASFIYGLFFSRELFFLNGDPAFIPVTILALGYLLDNKRTLSRWVLLVTAGFLLSHTSFISRLLVGPAAAYFIWFLLIDRRSRMSDWAIIIIFTVGVIGARWETISAIAAYGPMAARSVEIDNQSLIDFVIIANEKLAGMFFGYYYLPALCCIFLGLSLIKTPRFLSLQLIKALITYIFFLYLAAFTKALAVKVFPFLTGFNFTHMMEGFYLPIAIAGGVSFSYICDVSQGSGKSLFFSRFRRYMPGVAVVLVVIVNLSQKGDAAKAWVSWGNYHQATQSPVLKDLAKRTRLPGEPLRAMSFQEHGVGLNSYGIETIEGYHPMVSKRYREYFLQMIEPWRLSSLWTAQDAAIHLEATTLSVLPTRHQAVWRMSDLVNMDMLSLANGGFIVSRNKLTDNNLRLVSGPSKSWHSLTTIEKIQINLQANFSAQRHIFVYENLKVLPRVFTTGDVQLFDSGKQVLKALGQADSKILRNTVFAEKSSFPLDLKILLDLDHPDVVLEEYAGDQITVSVAPSTKPTVLIVTNNYSPFWICMVDGLETPIFPADHAFWGVVLPARAKIVIFKYKPPYLPS